jgi:hypothetical protein
MTLDGQSAVIEIGGGPPESKPEGVLNTTEALPEGSRLHIRLTPRLQAHGAEQRVALALNMDQARETPEGATAKRRLRAETEVPIGRTVIVTSRPEAEPRPLVMAVAVHLAQRNEAEPQQERRAQAEDLQQVVRQLERQLAERAAEAVRQRDQSAALRKQVEDLKAKLDELSGAAPNRINTVFRLQNAKATDVADALKILFAEVKLLGGDAQVESIQVAADSASNSLIVSAQSKHQEAIKSILSRLDKQPAQQAATPPRQAVNPSTAALLAKGLISKQEAAQRQQAEESARVQRETQVQLLKLDLQEAEIGLAAADKDLQRMQALKAHNSISQEEMAKVELQAQSAKIKVMRAKIMLDGAMRQLEPPPTNNPNPPTIPRSQSEPPR